MMALGFILGAITSAAFFYYGFKAANYPLDSKSAEPLSPILFKKANVKKKTPKSVSDYEQWKREQKQAPLDPGL